MANKNMEKQGASRNYVWFMLVTLLIFVLAFALMLGGIDGSNFDQHGALIQVITFFLAFMPILLVLIGMIGFDLSALKVAPFAFLLAVLLNEVRNKAFKRTVQTVTYLPHFLSMIVVVSIAQNVFATNGPLNNFLMSMNLVKTEVFWLGDKKYFWWLVGIINVWKEVGWNTIIYISAMTAIDPCLYEAAAIDGAGRFQRILHVTLPGIKSTFVILLIMSIGNLMNAGFEIQYLLGRGVVYDVASTIDIFVLKYGTEKLNIGVATAAGMFKSVVAIILLTIANMTAKALDEETLI